MSKDKKSAREKLSLKIPQNGNVMISENQIKMKRPLFVLKLEDEESKTRDLRNKIVAEEMPFQATCAHPDIKSSKDGKGLGQNIAYHIGGKFIAFVKGKSKMSESKDHCKVVVTSTTLEGIQYFSMKGAVQDLSFAHDFNYGMLGAIDEFGSVVVKLCVANSDSSSGSCGDTEKTESKLKLSTWLFVDGQQYNPKPMHFHRLVWIPFIEHENATEPERYIDEKKKHRISRILGITDGRSTEIWSVDEICTEYFNLDEAYKGQTQQRKIERSEIKKGRIQTLDSDVGRSPVVDLKISPCGEMLCTLDAFGEIRFYYLRENLANGSHLKLIKQFSTTSLDLSGCYPPAFSFFTFIDDYSKAVSDKLVWKCMIVGFDGNTILKVYDCQNWKELQRFDLDLNASSLGPFKAIVDPSGQCLVLSSTSSNVMLLFKLGNLYKVIQEENGFEEVFLQGIKSIHRLKMSNPYEYGAIASVNDKVSDSLNSVIAPETDIDIRFLGFGANGIDACKINVRVKVSDKPTIVDNIEKISQEISYKAEDIETTLNMENTREWIEKYQFCDKSEKYNRYCPSPKCLVTEKPLSIKSKSPVVDKVTRLKPSTRNSFSPVDSIELLKARKETSARDVTSTMKILKSSESLEKTVKTKDNKTMNLALKIDDHNLINLESMTPPMTLPTVYQIDDKDENEKVVEKDFDDKCAEEINQGNRISSSKNDSLNGSDEDIVIEKVEIVSSKMTNAIRTNNEILPHERPLTSTPERCTTPDEYSDSIVEKLRKELTQVKIDLADYRSKFQTEIQHSVTREMDQYSKIARDELKEFIREEGFDAYYSEKASINNTLRSSHTISRRKNMLASFPSVAVDVERIEDLLNEGKIEEALAFSTSLKYLGIVVDVCKKIDLISILKNENQISKTTLQKVFSCLTAVGSPCFSPYYDLAKGQPMINDKDSFFIKSVVTALFNHLIDYSQ